MPNSYEPDDDTLRKLADALGTTPENLRRMPSLPFPPIDLEEAELKLILTELEGELFDTSRAAIDPTRPSIDFSQGSSKSSAMNLLFLRFEVEKLLRQSTEDFRPMPVPSETSRRYPSASTNWYGQETRPTQVWVGQINRGKTAYRRKYA